MRFTSIRWRASIPGSAAQWPACVIISVRSTRISISTRWAFAGPSVSLMVELFARPAVAKSSRPWSRVPPALQLMQLFRFATGRQMRKSPDGGITIKSTVAVFG